LLRYHQVLDYTTRDNQRTIQFGFINDHPKGAGWRAYILTAIDYLGRDDGGFITHRYQDKENNMFYVCWTPEPASFDEMKAVAAMWSELTHGYIKTGESMNRQYARQYAGN